MCVLICHVYKVYVYIHIHICFHTYIHTYIQRRHPADSLYRAMQVHLRPLGREIAAHNLIHKMVQGTFLAEQNGISSVKVDAIFSVIVSLQSNISMCIMHVCRKMYACVCVCVCVE
jgi:hypothetical protein